MFQNYKEVILYLVFGGFSCLVSISTFALFYKEMGMQELVANGFSWVITVLFAFFTNRIWVFCASTKTVGEFLSQLGVFLGGRAATLILEEGILFLFAVYGGFSGMAVKIASQAVVIASNYAISKWVVFRKPGKEGGF